MINLKQTFRVRQTLNRTLQHSQQAESRVTERSAEIAIACKRDLLALLSTWLLGIKSATDLSPADRSQMQSLTRSSLDTWLHLQGEAVRLATELKAAEGAEQEAEAALSRKAPFRAVTKAFADSETKAQIKGLQNNLAAAQKWRDDLSAALKQNVALRQGYAEKFLRDCLSRLDSLTLTQALGKQAAGMRDRMVTQVNALWVDHAKQQAEDFGKIANLFGHLHTVYRDASAPSPPRRPLL